MKTVCKIFGLDYLQEEKSLLEERGTVFDPVYQDYRKKHADLIFQKREVEQGEKVSPPMGIGSRKPMEEPGGITIPGGAEEAEEVPEVAPAFEE